MTAEKYPTTNIYFFKDNRNTRKRCEICLKLEMFKQQQKIEQRQWRHFVVFTVNFKHFLNPFLVLRLLNLNNYMLPGKHVQI